MSESETFQNRQEKEIFFAALDKDTPAERTAFLDGACGQNATLRARVEALLADHFQQDAFMKKPAVEEARPTVKLSFIAEAVGTVIGRYKLLQQIGEGGCGVVYMAEQQEPVRRRVALKVIKLGMDTRQVIARFEAERQALALMDHPNISKVLDGGATDSGRPYFVMELVKGIPITRYCDEHQFSTAARLGLFAQVCHAVQHAHQKGIIHRDLKPSNILVADHDGVPVPKIIDFGIAKATTEQRLTDKTLFTAFEQFIGTPAYMSPEQANLSGLDLDTRTDIYSLGVLLYEMLTGTTPFEAKRLVTAGLDEIRRIIREEEPARPSTRLSTLEAVEQTTVAKHRQSDPPKLAHLIRGDLDWIVMKCLEKDRARRYETANGLAMDIQRHLQNEPVVACPPGNVYRFHKWARRNKLVFGAVGAVALALVAGLGFSTWAWTRERQVRAQEQRMLYTADLNLAQQAWEQNNLGRIGQLLEETRHFPNRGFEWYYWQRQTHQSLRTIGKNLGSLTSVAFSPDGQRFVTGGFGNDVCVWDVADGRKLLTLTGHKGYVFSVGWSPDGRRIATGSQDKTARVWDPVSGKELIALTGHSNEVRSVAFSPDGRRVVTGSRDGTARVWDAASGQELLHINWFWITSVAFSPDGQRIVTASETRPEAKVWDASNGTELLTLDSGGGINAAAFSPDGRRIATAGGRAVKLWDAATGHELLSLHAGESAIISVAFSPDSQQIVAGENDWTAKVWDAIKGGELLTLKEHIGMVSSAVFSPDGRQIVTGSFDGTAKLWNAAATPQPVTLKDQAPVSSVAFSADSQHVLTGGRDATAKVWDANNGGLLLALRRRGAPTNAVSSAARGVDDYSARDDCAAYSPDGQRIVTANDDKTATVWDASSGQELLTLKGHTGAICALAFSSDGLRIVSGSEDHTAKVWDAGSGRQLLTFNGHKGIVSAAVFSPDGRRIATGSWDWTVKIWEAATGRELLTLNRFSRVSPTTYDNNTPITSVAFSPDGRKIITANWDGTAKVWDAAGGEQVLSLKGHRNTVQSAAFSPDGHRIVTGSMDDTAKVWDAASGLELLTLKGHSGNVCSVAFSPDGRRIATGSADATVKIWEAARPEDVARWRDQEAAAK